MSLSGIEGIVPILWGIDMGILAVNNVRIEYTMAPKRQTIMA